MKGGKIVTFNLRGMEFVTHLFSDEDLDKCLICGKSYLEYRYTKQNPPLLMDEICTEINTAIEIVKKKYPPTSHNGRG